MGDTQQYVEDAVAAASAFMRRRELHDREAVRRQLASILNVEGSLALVLGAKVSCLHPACCPLHPCMASCPWRRVASGSSLACIAVPRQVLPPQQATGGAWSGGQAPPRCDVRCPHVRLRSHERHRAGAQCPAARVVHAAGARRPRRRRAGVSHGVVGHSRLALDASEVKEAAMPCPPASLPWWTCWSRSSTRASRVTSSPA